MGSSLCPLLPQSPPENKVRTRLPRLRPSCDPNRYSPRCHSTSAVPGISSPKADPGSLDAVLLPRRPASLGSSLLPLPLLTTADATAPPRSPTLVYPIPRRLPDAANISQKPFPGLPRSRRIKPPFGPRIHGPVPASVVSLSLDPTTQSVPTPGPAILVRRHSEPESSKRPPSSCKNVNRASIRSVEYASCGVSRCSRPVRLPPLSF